MTLTARGVMTAIGILAVAAFVASVTYLPHADSFSNPPTRDAFNGLNVVRLVDVYDNWLDRHATDDYRYTVHVDENVHWVAVADTERAASLRHDGIFYGVPNDSTPLSLRGLVHERGFHVGLVMFQQLTGFDWLDVFRFLPSAWAVVTALLVWQALRPWPGGIAAAGFVALIPTTARFLGPGFLVPIGFGLAWMAAALLLVPEVLRQPRAGGLLLMVLAWAFFIHLIAGFAVLLVVLCALPFARGERKGFVVLALLALLPVLALSQAFAGDVQGETNRLEFLPLDFTIFDQVGLPFLALWALACAYVALRPPEQARLPILASTAASVVVMTILVLNLAAHLHLYALYDRWHQPFVLFATVPVAYVLVGLSRSAATILLAGLRRIAARATVPSSRRRAWPTPPVVALTAALCIAGFVGATDSGLRYHIDEPYYHVIDDQDWAAFTFAAVHVNSTYDKFLGEPWKAVVFAAMTGKEPLAYLAPGSPPIHGEDWEAYLGSHRGDGVWLVQRGISLVEDRAQPEAREFPSTGPFTSQLDWTYAKELHDLRHAT